MRNIIIICSLLTLTGCATPQTTLQNKSGHVEVCGGSRTGAFLGGAIGYAIEKDQDEQCVERLKNKGYKETE